MKIISEFEQKSKLQVKFKQRKYYMKTSGKKFSVSISIFPIEHMASDQHVAGKVLFHEKESSRSA